MVGNSRVSQTAHVRCRITTSFSSQFHVQDGDSRETQTRIIWTQNSDILFFDKATLY